MDFSESTPTTSEHPELSSGSMDLGNPACPGDCTSPPDTFFSCVSSAMLTSPTPSNAGSTTTSPSSSKMYVLTYDATIWAHEDTTDKITLLDGTPITVAANEYCWNLMTA